MTVDDKLAQDLLRARCPQHGEFFEVGCVPCFGALRKGRDAFAAAMHAWKRHAEGRSSDQGVARCFPAIVPPWRPGAQP